jgi:hypothetical protein
MVHPGAPLRPDRRVVRPDLASGEIARALTAAEALPRWRDVLTRGNGDGNESGRRDTK